jgi:hypothetical protein
MSSDVSVLSRRLNQLLRPQPVRLHTIDKAQAGRMDTIVNALESLGLARIELQDRFTMINGSIDADCLESLRRVEGVASVREDQTYKTQ